MSTYPLAPQALASSSTHVLVSTGSTLHSISLETAEEPTSLPLSSSATQPHITSLVRLIAVSPDNTHAATISDDKNLRTYSISPFKLLSTRQTSKRCSAISFASASEIIISDKVGDVYRYPLEPRTSDGPRPTVTELATDPSKNPDADLMLGHVSVITAHVLTADGKRIITADRDEHIRVSRYPKAYVIDKYLFGSNGFVSALHIPKNKPELLFSAGGENALRMWDWAAGKQLGSVGIWEAILPHRRVRSSMRRNKRVKLPEQGNAAAAPEEEKGFYDAPEGWILPSGQGVCVRKIETMVVGDNTVVVFFSEGAAAIHAFVLPTDFSSDPQITTLPFSHPVLDFAILPSSQLLVSCDPAFNVFTHNQTGQAPAKGKAAETTTTAEQSAELSNFVTLVSVGSGASLESISSPLLTSVQNLLSQSSNAVLPKTLSALQLYPNLSLLPRWPGFEEDDELAGSNEPVVDPSTSAPNSAASTGPGPSENKAHSRRGTALYSKMAPSEAGTTGSAFKKDWTREELETLGPRQLGRLKAQGVDVGDLLGRKRIKREPGGNGGVRPKVDGATTKQLGDITEKKKEESGKEVDDESAMNV